MIVGPEVFLELDWVVKCGKWKFFLHFLAAENCLNVHANFMSPCAIMERVRKCSISSVHIVKIYGDTRMDSELFVLMINRKFEILIN